MFELISYCIIGGCLIWDLGLVLYLCIENAQEEAELEEILRQHARREWQKNQQLTYRIVVHEDCVSFD